MNNIEFIQNWFLTNNEYLANDNNKDAILHILTFYAIAFEKLEGLNNDDNIILTDGFISFTSGPIIENEESINLFKLINMKYGYLDYEDLAETTYKYIVNLKINGVLENETLVRYLKIVIDGIKDEFNNYDFNKFVYKINGYVFFCDKNLNENELSELFNISDKEQKLFEVFHDENGTMRVY